MPNSKPDPQGVEGRPLTPEELRDALNDWRRWAQFVFLGGGPVRDDDATLRIRLCQECDKREDEARAAADAAREALRVELDEVIADRDAVTDEAVKRGDKLIQREREVVDLRAEVARLRAQLEAAIKECRKCSGTNLIPRHTATEPKERWPLYARIPCDVCAPWRAALSGEEPGQ